jgi:uncharacterized protein DUF4013
MDISKAFTYPFEDPDWTKKLGIAAGIGFVALVLSPVLIGLIGLIPLAGWSIETMKRVRRNEPNPMASWDDFGGLFNKGLTPFLAALVYQIPTLLFYCAAAVILFLPALGGGNDDATTALLGTASTGLLCCGCLIVLYAIAASIIEWGGLMRYLDKEEFGTFMEIGENLSLVRSNINDFGMALLYMIIGNVVTSVLAGIPCIGWLAAFPFSFYYSSHILGQLSAKLSATAKPAM